VAVLTSLAVLTSPVLAVSLGPAPARLVGTYVAEIPNYPDAGWYKGRYRLVLGPGTAFAVRNIPGTGSIVYQASYTKTRVSLPAGSGCSTAGTYTWTLHGASVEFRAVSEPCRGRALMLDRRWTRLR
jgi:hypothetical protein